MQVVFLCPAARLISPWRASFLHRLTMETSACAPSDRARMWAAILTVPPRRRPFSVWIASDGASEFSTVTPLCKLGVKVRPTVTHHSVQAFPLSKTSLFKQPLVEEELCYPLHSLFLGRKVWCMLTACLIFVFQGLFLLGVKSFRCMRNTHLKYSCFSESLKCTSKS